MRIALRCLAIAIAAAGLVDPAIARRVPSPLSVEFRLPSASHPDFDRSLELREQVARALGPRSQVDRGSAPHAIVVVGDAQPGAVGEAQVFAMPVPVSQPGVSIAKVAVPRRSAVGQFVVVGASLRSLGLSGRASTASLMLRGATLASARHTWSSDDERFEAKLGFTPPGPGVHRVRIAVSTDGLSGTAVADAVVDTRDERVRVLVYEPRPSWPVTFVRRSLEADALFDVVSSVRTSRSAQTISGDAPATLRDVDVDEYDALVAGALEDLRDPDLTAIERFVTERGGTLILLPDRQVPVAVRRRLDLPALDEVLLEKPVDVRGTGVSFEGSELLVLGSGRQLQPLAVVQQGTSERIVVGALTHGAGRTIFSGALDAWRYRARSPGAFDASWRALIADASLGAPPKIDVHVYPGIARPGEPVTVSVAVRQTEMRRDSDTITVPPVSAWLLADGRSRESVRLWPAATVGSFEATFAAPSVDRAIISVSMAGATTDVLLHVAEDAVQAVEGVSGAPAHAAAASGGAVTSDPGELVRALSALDTGTQDETSRPMRSPWCIVPFASLLVAEWGLRRRSGLK